MRNLIVSIPDYWKFKSSLVLPPQNFQDLMERIEKPGGYWQLQSIDTYTGEVIQEAWLSNVLTDTGATAAWKNLINSSGSAVSIYNQIAITTAAGVTTLQSALTNGQSGITSLTVAALPGTIASGTTLTLGAGSGTTQNVTTSALASAGATSISVTSFTASAAFAIGTNVAPNPTTSDNPSSLSGTVSYSGALSAGAFTFSGTGAGNRQVQVQYTFSTTGSPAATAANYTEAWLVNTNPVSGTGQTAVHLIFSAAQAISSSSQLQCTIIEKL